ncbi:uncharacterized protein [Musca autumnalis]|uniref:uncharacterized protein n=1 Tax=Musca autumnalis TaxID=221902 RepID=UPI003CFAFC78
MEVSVGNTKEIPEFILEYKARLARLLERLKWTQEGVLKSFNTNSSASVLKGEISHTDRCHKNKKANYPDSLITDNSVTLSTPELQNLLGNSSVEAPQNFNELQGNFSRDEKLAIYEFTIENTTKINNNVVEEVPEGVSSLADIVAEKKREAKRKKRKFRKTKPTLKEEMRALVLLQMQALEQYRGNQRALGSAKEKVTHETEHESNRKNFDKRNIDRFLQHSRDKNDHKSHKETSKDRKHSTQSDYRTRHSKYEESGKDYQRKEERYQGEINKTSSGVYGRSEERKRTNEPDKEASNIYYERRERKHEREKKWYNEEYNRSNGKYLNREAEKHLYSPRSPHTTKDYDKYRNTSNDLHQRRDHSLYNELHKGSLKESDRHKRSRSRDNMKSSRDRDKDTPRSYHKEQYSRNRSRSPHYRRDTKDYNRRRSKSPGPSKKYADGRSYKKYEGWR